ncbi:MAG: DMT family transporter [Syntrophobacterales bacterium]|nr:MAG: DMT family transporter [Syntrophobacterales bacterium]
MISVEGGSGKERIDLFAASLLTGLCLLWGLNAVAIKVSNQGIAPIFGAGVRSVIATGCLVSWMKLRKIALFPGSLIDGLIVGVFFGVEFGVLYSSLLYTTASSAWILLYTTPFFHAVGAHYFLEGDRLNFGKGVGLILAFGGVVFLLSEHAGLPSLGNLLGDILAVMAAIIWAATTIFIKRRLVGKVSYHHTLFYQTLFSIPVLFLLSTMFGEQPIRQINGLILFSVAYQGILIAFISYLLWFFLVHSYPVSKLSAFTFLTPLFAVTAGVFLLQESLTPRLILSLFLVSLGIYVVNRKW